MKTPLVTIAIPAYKVKFLKEAICSSLNQTYSNIEVIVVDDVSPEDVGSVVNSFYDTRLKYYRNETNLGSADPAGNWNKCLSYARGDFFVLLCDDDILHEDFVRLMLSLVQDFPDCNVYRARANIIDKNGIVKSLYPSSPRWESSGDYMWHVFNGYRIQTITEFMYRTEFLKEKGGYLCFPQAWGADYALIFKLAQYGGIASTNEVLVSFRLSGDNISSQLDRKIIGKLEANKQVYDYTKLLLQCTTSSMVELLLEDIEIWKKRMDRNTLCYCRIKDYLQVIRRRYEFGYSITTFLKAKFFYWLIVKRHK